MPGELAVARVPSRRRELGAEVDQRVARQLLLAHRARDAEDLVGSVERAMRLLIAERPARRHLRQAGDARVLAHDDRRIASTRRRTRRAAAPTQPAARSDLAVPGEVERAVRLMDEHRPAVRADEPLDRRARAVRREAIAALPVRIMRSVVPLRSNCGPPSPSPSSGPLPRRKDMPGAAASNVRRWTTAPVRVFTSIDRRSVVQLDDKVAGPDPRHARRRRSTSRHGADARSNQLAGERNFGRMSIANRLDRDPRGHGAQRCDGDLDRLARDRDPCCPESKRARAEHETRARSAELFDGVAPREMVGHVTRVGHPERGEGSALVTAAKCRSLATLGMTCDMTTQRLSRS